jgi:hypothetical protein
MKHTTTFASIVCVLILSVATAHAGVQVISERNEPGTATSKFKFKKIPSPSRTDAAANASFSIIGSRQDPNGAGVRVLHDGQAPGNNDEPSANFFFTQGAKGGRILLDLGKPTAVKQINTYSWHSQSRGPQVYKLYAAAGSEKGLNAKPQKNVTPDQAGWKLLASVDTRPKQGSPGGQYGVSVSDTAGKTIGTFRYLLFDVSQTQNQDIFGNTFFSEIDVDDGKSHKPPPTPKPETVSIADGCEMILDYTQMPELKDWINASLKPVCVKWYPIIVKMLAAKGIDAPKRFSITFRPNMRGVAATGGTRIYCAGRWFKQNLQGEAVGAVVHEMVHVAQQYRPVRGGRRNPSWMVEGLADYIRWFCYEPKSKRPRVNPARAKYTDSYRTTAAFMNYAVENYDKDIVRKFNAAMRQGKYAPELWKKYTGKTIDELWAEFIKTLPKR